METKKADLSSLRIDRTEISSAPSSRKKFIIIIIIILIAVLAFIGYLIWGSLFNPAIEVKLTTAVLQTPGQANAILTASGYVVAQRQASVASKGTGRLVYLSVVEGDKLKKNQVIARLEDNDIRALLEEAKANLKLNEADLQEVENNFKRQKALLQSGSSTQMELDAAEADYNRVLASIGVAIAQVHAAEVALENTLIRAPFDGTVLTKNAEIGEIVAPLGASTTSRGAVVTMADMNSLQVEADVSESNIEKISLNMECEIILDAYPGHSYPAYVAKIVPTADRAKATVLVKVGFKEYDSRVLPEMSAKVSFLTEAVKDTLGEERSALIVPFTAVENRDGKKVVYAVRDDLAVEIPVTTGREFGIYVEITSGISNGDKIIERVTDDIKDGIKVRIL